MYLFERSTHVAPRVWFVKHLSTCLCPAEAKAIL